MKRIFASVFLAMTVLITGCSAAGSNAAPNDQSPVTEINSPTKSSSENNESSADWLSGKRFGGGTSRNTVKSWLKEIGIAK